MEVQIVLCDLHVQAFVVKPEVMLSSAFLTSVIQFSSLARTRNTCINVLVLGAPFCPVACLTAVKLLSNCAVAQGFRRAGFLFVHLPNLVIWSTLNFFCQTLLPLPNSAEI